MNYYDIVFNGATLSFDQWLGSCELRDLLYGIKVGSVRNAPAVLDDEAKRLLGHWLEPDQLRVIYKLMDAMWEAKTPSDDLDQLIDLYRRLNIDDRWISHQPIVTVSSLDAGLNALSHDVTFDRDQGYHLSLGHIGMRRSIIDVLHVQAIDELLEYMDSIISVPNAEAVEHLKSLGWVHTEIPDADGNWVYASIQTAKGELVYI